MVQSEQVMNTVDIIIIASVIVFIVIFIIIILIIKIKDVDNERPKIIKSMNIKEKRGTGDKSSDNEKKEQYKDNKKITQVKPKNKGIRNEECIQKIKKESN